jgi:hypothetical protein
MHFVYLYLEFIVVCRLEMSMIETDRVAAILLF